MDSIEVPEWNNDAPIETWCHFKGVHEFLDDNDDSCMENSTIRSNIRVLDLDLDMDIDLNAVTNVENTDAVVEYPLGEIQDDLKEMDSPAVISLESYDNEESKKGVTTPMASDGWTAVLKTTNCHGKVTPTKHKLSQGAWTDEERMHNNNRYEALQDLWDDDNLG